MRANMTETEYDIMRERETASRVGPIGTFVVGTCGKGTEGGGLLGLHLGGVRAEVPPDVDLRTKEGGVRGPRGAS